MKKNRLLFVLVCLLASTSTLRGASDVVIYSKTFNKPSTSIITNCSRDDPQLPHKFQFGLTGNVVISQISAICHDLHSPVIIDESGIQRVIVQQEGQDAANRADIIHRGCSAVHFPCHREETTANGQFTRTCCVPVGRNHLHSFRLAHTLARQKARRKSRKFLCAQSRFLPMFLQAQIMRR